MCSMITVTALQFLRTSVLWPLRVIKRYAIKASIEFLKHFRNKMEEAEEFSLCVTRTHLMLNWREALL